MFLNLTEGEAQDLAEAYQLTLLEEDFSSINVERPAEMHKSLCDLEAQLVPSALTWLATYLHQKHYWQLLQ